MVDEVDIMLTNNRIATSYRDVLSLSFQISSSTVQDGTVQHATTG